MSGNQGSITVNQKKVTTPVPPFPLNAAENGLSVDPISKKIVLGNDVGAVGDPAQLLSFREMKLKGFYLDYIGQTIEQFFDDGNGLFQLYRNPAGVLSFNVDTVGRVYQLGEDFRIEISQPGQTIKLRSNAEPYLNILAAPASRNLALGIGSPELFLNDLGANKQAILNTDVTVPNAIRFGMEKTGSLAYIKVQNDSYFSLDVASGLYEFGDISGTANNTFFKIDDTNQIATIEFGAGNAFLNVDVLNSLFWIGDIPGVTTNTYFYLDNRSFTITANGKEMMEGDIITGRYKFGDVNTNLNGIQIFMEDAANRVNIFNAANTAKIVMNGVNGFTGTVTPVTTITVNGGIVTNVA